jgi:SAM-dependent methyltransferase
MTDESKHLSRDAVHEYWRQPDGVNATETYTSASVGRSLFLVESMKTHAHSASRILELGCNAGRNLDFLFHAGFRRLGGIEISQNAVNHLRITYPELKGVEVTVAPIEEAIRNIPDDSFDVVFTVAVLEHLHFDSDWIFAEMKRVARKVLIIEDEVSVSERHFRRDYRSVFEALGLHQIDFSEQVPGLPKAFRYRVFSRDPAHPNEVDGADNLLRELGLSALFPDRELEEKAMLVLSAIAHEKRFSAKHIALRTGTSIEFVKLLQRHTINAGWCEAIGGEETCLPFLKDNEPALAPVVRAFAKYMDARWRSH